MGRPRPAPPSAQTRIARDRRDASLARVSRLTTAVVMGALALVGAFGLYVSRLIPGHQARSQSTSATQPAGTSQNPATPPTAPAGTSGETSPTPTPPTAPPVRTHAPPVVSTGAS